MGKNKLIIFGMLMMIPAVLAGTDYITPEDCTNIQAWNVTDNSTYTVTICARHMKRNIDKNLTYGELFTISEENVSVRAPPIANDTGDICEINATLDMNEELLNSTHPCNVDIRTTETYCPACENKTIDICSITHTITPEENNTVTYLNDSKECNIKINVSECPICVKFSLPDEHSVIPDIELSRLVRSESDCALTTEKYFECANDYQILQNTSEEMAKSYCPIDDDVLLFNYKKLSKMEKKYLKEFVKIGYPMTSYRFAEFASQSINPTEEEFANIYWESDVSLRKFYDVEFAQHSIRRVYYPAINVYKNESAYYPIITVHCLKKVEDLGTIKTTGYVSGVKNMGIGSLSTILVILVGLGLFARSPWIPWR